VSGEPYATMNLADHVDDDPARVSENRTRAARRITAAPPDPAAWVWLRQVHGVTVVDVDGAPATAPEADAAVTTTVGLPLVVLTADCAPIALVAPDAIGVLHAGWPGLEQGVIGAAVAALRARSSGRVRAVLGPCVHPERYEFGADLLARLVERLGPEVAARTGDGAPALDIPAAVRISLARAGVDDLTDVGVCTAASTDHFSYRRDGVTGRQAVVVVRTS
jgi:purine-nucleoside/S-methyl-5'-thioadenosine phosphorylase / adenosine deaminase